MATSFVEQAILRVKDESSGKIGLINRRLNDLLNTTRKFRSTSIKLKVELVGDVSAVNRLNRIATLRKVPLEMEIRNVAATRRLISSIARKRQISLDPVVINTARARSQLAGLSSNVRVNFTQLTSALRTVSRINTLMNDLSRRPPTLLIINSNQVLTAIARVQRLTAAMNAIPRGANLGMAGAPRAPRAGIGGAATPGVPRSPVSRRIQPTSFAEGAWESFSAPRFGQRVGTLLTYTILGEVEFAVRSVIVRAASATIESQNVTTTQLLSLGERDIINVNELARELSSDVRGTSVAANRAALTNLALAVPSSSEGFAQVSAGFLTAIERLGAINPARAESDAAVLAKILDLSQIEGDPLRGVDLTTAFAQGVAATGETFNATSFLAALRVSGLAPSLSGEGLFRTMLQFDEQGRRAGEGLRRLDNVLNQDMGVSQGQRDALIASGLVDADTRLAVGAELFGENPAAWVSAILIPALQAQNPDLDTTNAIAVGQALRAAGFVTAEARILQSEVVAQVERANSQRMATEAGLVRTMEAADTNMGSALRNLVAGFDSLSSEILTPLFERLAPVVNEFGDFMRRLSLGTDGLTGLQEASLLAGAALSSFYVARGGMQLIGLLNPLNRSAVALNGSAAALTRAAWTLGAAGRGGVPVPVGGRPGRRVGAVPIFSSPRILGPLTAFAGILAAAPAMESFMEAYRQGPDSVETWRKNNLEVPFQNLLRAFGVDTRPVDREQQWQDRRDAHERRIAAREAAAAAQRAMQDTQGVSGNFWSRMFGVESMGPKLAAPANIMGDTRAEQADFRASVAERQARDAATLDAFNRASSHAETLVAQWEQGMATLSAMFSSMLGVNGMGPERSGVLATRPAFDPKEEWAEAAAIDAFAQAQVRAGQQPVKLMEDFNRILHRLENPGETAMPFGDLRNMVATPYRNQIDAEAAANNPAFMSGLQMMHETGVDLEATFLTGATHVGLSIDESALAFGPTVADGIHSRAASIGAAIGIAAAAELQRVMLNLNVRAPAQSLPRMNVPPIDTGAGGPF